MYKHPKPETLNPKPPDPRVVLRPARVSRRGEPWAPSPLKSEKVVLYITLCHDGSYITTTTTDIKIISRRLKGGVVTCSSSQAWRTLGSVAAGGQSDAVARRAQALTRVSKSWQG